MEKLSSYINMPENAPAKAPGQDSAVASVSAQPTGLRPLLRALPAALGWGIAGNFTEMGQRNQGAASALGLEHLDSWWLDAILRTGNSSTYRSGARA